MGGGTWPGGMVGLRVGRGAVQRASGLGGQQGVQGVGRAGQGHGGVGWLDGRLLPGVRRIGSAHALCFTARHRRRSGARPISRRTVVMSKRFWWGVSAAAALVLAAGGA